MSYALYNGKMIQSESKYVIKNVIPGQIYFTDQGIIDFPSLPVVTGSQTIKWDMNLDSSVASILALNFIAPAGGADFLLVQYGYLQAFEQGTTGITYPVLRVQVKNSPGVIVRMYDINSYIGINANIEIVKGTGSITSVKANNNTLTTLYSGTGVFDAPADNKYISAEGGISIWNLEIVGLHKWIGYPYGNQDSAWVDTIGSIDPTILGSPGTRNLL